MMQHLINTLLTRDDAATIDLEQFAAIEFTLRADSLNEETRSVDAVFATQDAIRTYNPALGFFDEILLMRGAQLVDQIPLFDSHPEVNRSPTTEDIRGSGRNMRIEGDQLIGRMFFDDDEPALRAFKKIQNGHLKSVSIGAQRLDVVRIAPGKTATVDGQQFTAKDVPLVVTRKWRPKEISITPIGLDPRATVRADAPINTEVDTVPKELRAYLESLGLRSDASDAEAWKLYKTLKGDQIARANTLRGDWLPEGVTEAPAVDPVTEPVTRSPAPQQPNNNPQPQQPTADEIRRAVQADRQRCETIRSLGSELNIGDDLVTRAIDSDWNEAEINRQFLSHIRERRGSGSGADNSGHVGIHSRSREDGNREVLGAALMLRGGLALDHDAFNGVHTRQALYAQSATRFLTMNINDDRRQQIMDTAHRFAGLSAIDLCREAIRLDGGTVPHGYDDIIRAAVSGGSLSNVFTTSAYAQLIASYTETMDSTRGWVREADVANFQSNERPRLKKGGGLQRLPRGATADHRGFDDDAESYKIARYAEQFVVDEQDIIDDRLNALTDVPMEMGMDAARIRPDLVYALLFANAAMADGTVLFHTNRNNLNTGSAFGFSTLQTAWSDMATHQEGGVNLNIRPTHLIAPVLRSFDVAEVLRSVKIMKNQSADTESGDANATRIVVGDLTPVHDSRLDNGVTDPASGTAYSGATGDWFLADGNRPAIEVGYRRGTGRSPQMRSFVLTQGQWGVGWDVNIDVGTKAIRALSIHKSEE